jgi:ketosteroid isomerase-like protein
VDARAAHELIARYWNDRDWLGLENLFDPQVRGVAPDAWPDLGERVGWDELRAQFERVREPWAEDTVEIIEIVGGVERAAASFHWRCRGYDSGVELDETMSASVRVRGDRIVEIRYFRDFNDAVTALED